MTNAFTKHNDAWVIKADRADLAGQDIIVTTRAGAQKNVTLAQYLGPTQGGRFDGHLYAIAERAPAAAAPAQAVGDLSPIMALFDRARAHLKYPAIVLDGFRVSVAGARASNPGTLNVTGIEKHFNAQRGRDERTWFGRVSLDGSFAPSRAAPADLADKLRAFAADPAGVAAAFGHLHGACCFCMRALSDDRSTAVGYGPICADHFGLPWGERAAPAAEATAAAEAATERQELRDERRRLADLNAGERDLGTARGTAQSRARRTSREFAARAYG